MSDDYYQDYLSDEFLKEGGDIRPGLLNREGKRNIRVEKYSAKDVPKAKKVKHLEEEARVKGLGAPISTDSKGYAILRKMGYKEGTSLGKSGTGSTSLIPVVIKDGKSGLGREQFVREKKEESTACESQRFADFRQRKQKERQEAKIYSDLRKSRLACHQLDTECGHSTPVEEWYWPEEFRAKEEEDDDAEKEESNGDDGSHEEEEEESSHEEEVDEEPEKKLEDITAYLRHTHYYCIWCGTAYQDGGDLRDNCPGNTEEAHE